MITEISTVAFKGIEISDVTVQIHLQNGIPAFNIVGLPDKAVAESRERVRSVLANLGLSLPAKRITVNLSPANLIKEGCHFDLPITLGILENLDVIPKNSLDQYYCLGELSLDGKILHVPGILPSSVYANEKAKGLICPHENGSEAIWSGNQLIIAAKNITDLIRHFKNQLKIPFPEKSPSSKRKKDNTDFSDIVGQESGKRAMEITAAGKHNLMMIGPPGSGKSMLAARLCTILPRLSKQEILETSMVLSIAGKIKHGQLSDQISFRSPHHSCSEAAMTGGGQGKRIMPGEVSLAHNGVLFLDEMPEFNRSVIDALRQPIENHYVDIARANSHVRYPAKFQLIAAMNPCKCGYAGIADKQCRKHPICASDYINKISGPIYDRFDIFIHIPEIKPTDIPKYQEVPRETSDTILKRVENAHNLQAERYKDLKILFNSELPAQNIVTYIQLSDKASDLLNKITDKMQLSMRGYFRLLKVARTIADLDLSEQILEHHLLEAANYRSDLRSLI